MNMNTLGVLSALVSLVMASGCDGGRVGSTATSPTIPTQPPAATYTLSGSVSETTGGVSSPLEGARVVDTYTGRSAMTDANGLYTLSVPATSRAIAVSKEGYITRTTALALTSDAQLDISLDRIPIYVLSGVVFELTAAGQVPIDGVELYCDSCGSPDGHTFVYTDANGFYRLEWTTNGAHPLFVRKAGYAIFDPNGTLTDQLGRISANVDGDTRFDIQLVRR